jgi:hypothetical protein
MNVGIVTFTQGVVEYHMDGNSRCYDSCGYVEYGGFGCPSQLKSASFLLVPLQYSTPGAHLEDSELGGMVCPECDESRKSLRGQCKLGR